MRSKISFFMYNTIFVYILRVPVSMKGSKGHQKSRKQRKQTGFKELAHICVLCSAIASPSLLSSSPIRVNPSPLPMPGFTMPKPGYTMPQPGFTSLNGLRGPESCGGRNRRSGRSSKRPLTRPDIKEALRGATADLVRHLTQEIRAKLQPLIPPHGSPVTIGASPHQV